MDVGVVSAVWARRAGPRTAASGSVRPAQLPATRLTAAAGPAVAQALAGVEVYSYDARTGKDTLVQRTGGPVSSDAVARQAYDNAVKVLDHYMRVYGRNSYDNRGTVLKLRVHAPDPQSGQTPDNNAYWFNDEGRIWLGDGDGVRFAPLGNAVDVVAHEFTHGVVDAEVALSTWGQEGGLHESFADVMATGLDGNWQIGETVFTPNIPGDAVRDLQNPRHDHVTALPPGETEPHALADVPNHAAWKVASALGADAMRRIWYTALTDHLKPHSGFAGARQATLSAAAALHGGGSTQYAAVRDAWDAVGVTASTARHFFWSESTGFHYDVRALEKVNVRQAALRALAQSDS